MNIYMDLLFLLAAISSHRKRNSSKGVFSLEMRLRNKIILTTGLAVFALFSFLTANVFLLLRMY